jgi:hypothetical protein
VGDGKQLFTVGQIAIYSDVLWLIVRVQITTIGNGQIIPEVDS